MEILMHDYDDEPCDQGLDPHEDRICGHGYRVHPVWLVAAA